MTLILLDIDGVMVPANSWRKPEFHEDDFPMFSARSIDALKKIIFETNATLLLTTSHKTRYSLVAWRDIFMARGIPVTGIARLDKNETNPNRKDEILNWYQNRRKVNEPFVIIDDDKLLNDLPDNLKANLVLTSSSVGLTDDLADNAILILKRQNLAYT